MSIMLRSIRCVAVAIIFSTTISFAQQKANPYVIEINGQLIHPSANAQQWFDSVKKNKPTQPSQVLLQFQELPSELQKQRLATNGITLLDYIPHNVFAAILHAPLNNINASGLGIRSVIELVPEWKVDGRITREFNLRSSKRAALLVSFVKQTSFQTIDRLLNKYEGTVTDKRFEAVSTFTIELPQNKVHELAKEALVSYISLPANIQTLNFDARSSAGANRLSLPISPGGYQLDGSGVTVGVGDNTSAIYHVDARDRVINFNPAGAMMHGVHTTVTVGGKGIMDPRTLGLAPSVNILNHIYNLVWGQTKEMYADHNMTITNNSYAATVGDCSYAGTYDQYSRMLDETQKDFPFVQHVFAAGNDGLMQCGSFPTSYGTVTGGFQPAKNILTVGGMTKANLIWPRTSRGPVKDGRLKPEITAYSFSIYSGDVFDGYGHSNGTSMSSPVVAGSLALLQQRYGQLQPNRNMPTDLMKALAMNGATDVGNPGPDYSHGFGLVNVVRSLDMLDANRFIIDSVDNGGVKSYNIAVPPNTSKLKVMLYWHDVAASPLASTSLVNNLDLELITGSTTYLPWVLDPTPGNVANVAVRGVDTRNNVEQITVDNPSSGNYALVVKGALLPAGRQRYVVVYDFVPDSLMIQFPVAGSSLPAGDSLFLYWDAPDNANDFTLEYSADNGASWTLLSSNIPATQRHFFWRTPSISSAACLFRVKRNNSSDEDISGPFVINPEPKPVLSANQCPGYMAIEWNAIPNVTGYQMLLKVGDDLRPVDTVVGTSYAFKGLSLHQLHYAAVRPLVNGVAGWRSKGLRRLPNDGNCGGSISDGDLMVEAITNPTSGRHFTSTALSGAEAIAVRIRNLDDVQADNYRLHYSINGGTWQTRPFTAPIPANDTHTVTLPPVNFAPAGSYQIRVAVEHLIPDPVSGNDTAMKLVRQLQNAPLDITTMFTDDFESAPVFSLLQDERGVLPNDHWDFENSTDSGRLRSFVASDVVIDGQRSMSMDLLLNKPDNQNYLIGTFNLQNFSAANDEARLEFDYKLHAKPKFLAGNEVWVRGSDTAKWVSVHVLDTMVIPGTKVNTGSLSLTHPLLQSGQDFSSSFQVRIGQRDTSVIAMNEYGNGLTIDNFKLYTVKNDVQLLSIVRPRRFNCSLDSSALTVLVYNSDNLPQDTVELFYTFNNGAVVRDTIFFFAPKDTVTHTFPIPLATLGQGAHTLNVWLRAQGDTYTANDSILNYQVRNQPSIASFPYLQDFESGDGSWYAEGFNTTWQYGTPGSLRLKKAASGSKVWATSLDGNYRDNEESYLYSPCFDLSSLQQPMLSFSLSTHIENCGGVLCDGAYVEYSIDGINWTKLGTAGEGFNWYGDLQVWNDTNTRWRVASIPLPKGFGSMSLRFVMKSDAGVAWDGIAIDDIHIYDLSHPVYDGAGTQVSAYLQPTQWTNYLANGAFLAQVRSASAGDEVGVQLFRHDYVLNPVVQQYHLGRNFVVSAAQSGADSSLLRLFITDDEVKQLVTDAQCDSCRRAEDAYRLGISRYADESGVLNGSLSDNITGNYSFIPHEAVRWVPYEKGYYAEFSAQLGAEFWFNAGMPPKALGNMIVYPNPVLDGKLTMVWTAPPGSAVQLFLYDVAGRKVYDASAVSNDFDSKTVFHLPPLATGVYTLRCIMGNMTQTYQLLIQK